MGRGGRAAMWVLPGRPAHGRRGVAGQDAEADRPRHRGSDERPPLPVRYLPADSQSDPSRRRARAGPCDRGGARPCAGCRSGEPLGWTMSSATEDTMTRVAKMGAVTAMDRRGFLRIAGMAGGGLLLSYYF